MKQNKIKFEFLKTNKGNWVINYDNPKFGFNLHGEPEEVKNMYCWLIHGNSNMPRLHEFENKIHYLFESECIDDEEDEDENN